MRMIRGTRREGTVVFERLLDESHHFNYFGKSGVLIGLQPTAYF